MVFVVLLFALIASLPVQAAEKSSAPLKIVAFGDSLTSGHRLARKEAYPSILQAKLTSAGLPFTVVNEGVSGDTTAGALRRLDRALSEQPQMLILELGVNDGLRGVPVPQVKANLAAIIEAAQARTSRSCCAGWKRCRCRGGSTRSTSTACTTSWRRGMTCRSCHS
jgi:acyl-CoA thioesterase-1